MKGEITADDVVKAASKLRFPISFGEAKYCRAPYEDPWLRWDSVSLNPHRIADIFNKLQEKN